VYRRVVGPGGAALRHSGGLFALGQHEALRQVGEVQQQIAILRWLQPAEGEMATMFAQREIGEDIAALLSLATRRRIRTLPEVTAQQQGTTTTIFIPTADFADSELPSPLPESAVSTVEPLMWSILSISDEDQFKAIAQAVRLYHAALLAIPSAPTAGYTLLVAAIETLAGQAELPPTVWDDWSDAVAWNTLLAEIGVTNAQADAIRLRLLSASHLNLTRRFVAYGARMVPASFWTEAWEVWAPGIKIEAGDATLIEGHRPQRPVDERARHGPAQLPGLLRNVYRARSGYIHEGETLRTTALVGFPEVQLAADSADPPRGNNLPSLEYLERLVGAVLVEAIRLAPKQPSFRRPDLQITG
jgi:hypothetical protein